MSDPYLTGPEKVVMMLVAHGCTVADIAGITTASVSSVNLHIYHVRCRLNAKNTAHAVWLCVQHRLLDPWTVAP